MNSNNINKFVSRFKTKNYKFLILNILKEKKVYNFIKYLVCINVTKSNIFLTFSNIIGLVQKSYSKYSLKLKKNSMENEVFNKVIKYIFINYKFVNNNPIAFHFVNLNFDFDLFFEKTFKKFTILSYKFFEKFSFNGCRKKKFKKTKNG